MVGENVGAGDVRYFEDESRWIEASEKGMAAPVIASLPAGYKTQLGKWFKDGRELSGGQWQKIALSRAFMRTQADVLVLDEPTAAMDAAAEATIFEHFRNLTTNKIAILISHRFSTVRMADQIVVIQEGRIVERGSHDELMKLNGHYAHLFSLQAKGYR
jgi:ATP-binding cassette subfamily B protein